MTRRPTGASVPAGTAAAAPRARSAPRPDRYTAAARVGGSDGQHTLAETEHAVSERLRGLPIDVAPMSISERSSSSSAAAAANANSSARLTMVRR